MDSRAVTPVVEKVIAIGLVALFVGGLSATLYGGTVPQARDAVGDELAERVLATATQRVEQAVPPNGTAVRASQRVDLPATIRGSSYRIETDGRWLVLDHPDDAVGERSRLTLPDSVVGVDGAWGSGGDAVVAVRSVDGGLAVELREGSP